MKHRVQKASILGAAFAAVLSLTAFAGVASATPAKLKAQEYPASLSGETGEYQVLGTVVGAVDCDTSLAGSIEGQAQSFAADFSGECQSFSSWHEIEANECQVEPNPYWETYAIGPEGCGPMTVQVGFCQISIPAQGGLEAEYETVAGSPSTVKMTSLTESLTYSTGPSFCSGYNNKTLASGKLLGSWTLSAENSGEEAQDLSLREGVYDSIFEAETYPVELSGSQGMGEVFGTEAGAVECEVASTGSLSEEWEPLVLAPSYSGCEAFSYLNATVDANGCTVMYQGTLNHEARIECPEGEAITITAAFCAIEIPAQTGLSTVGYENTSVEGHGAIEVTPEISGLTYEVTKDGLFCKFNGKGTRTDGTMVGTTTVVGADEAEQPVNIRVNG